jgi:hypothetical protein
MLPEEFEEDMPAHAEVLDGLSGQVEVAEFFIGGQKPRKRGSDPLS